MAIDPLSSAAVPTGSPAGRKLDRSRDGFILDATLQVLAERGYDGMTIDLVAARSGAARATVYRRWATKSALVLAAVARLSAEDTAVGEPPDTGSLRGDLMAVTLPLDSEAQQLRIRALGALITMSLTEPELAEAATTAGLGPWTTLNRRLIQRATDRGEFPPADVETLAEVLPMMCMARAIRGQPITAEFSLHLIDHVLIPALRGSGRHP